MKIDIAKPEGHTLSALGIATRFLEKTGAKKAYIDDLARSVFKANSAVEARRIIEERTGGAVTFYDSRHGG